MGNLKNHSQQKDPGPCDALMIAPAASILRPPLIGTTIRLIEIKENATNKLLYCHQSWFNQSNILLAKMFYNLFTRPLKINFNIVTTKYKKINLE